MALRSVCKALKASVRNVSNLSMSQVVAPLQEASLEEKCIIVDGNDNALGSATKRDCHKVQKDGSILLHRAFSVFIFNSKGEILLQQRSPGKITFPNHITNACCSHPLYDIPNERNEENAVGIKHAAQRRLNYELGVPLEQTKLDDYHYITRIHYQATDDNVWGEHEIDYILFLRKDLDLFPNSDEVSLVKYVSQKEFHSFITGLKSPITPWFRLIVQNYLHKWWNSLDNLDKFKDHISSQNDPYAKLMPSSFPGLWQRIIIEKRSDDEDLHKTPPWNFYWVSEGELAGMAWPQSKTNILYLIDQGIRHLITLSPEKKPPVGLCPKIEWTEIPVPEFEAPTLEQIGKFIEICDRSRQQNKAVGIHCRQGRGRTGVMAACFLVRFKDLSPGRAITDIRIKLPGSIETYEQERIVTKYHDYCRKT